MTANTTTTTTRQTTVNVVMTSSRNVTVFLDFICLCVCTDVFFVWPVPVFLCACLCRVCLQRRVHSYRNGLDWTEPNWSPLISLF